MIDALILVGGKGTRLQSVVSDRPKPMALVMGKPFLEWLIISLRNQGIRRIILCTGYKGEMIESYFADGAWLGLELLYSHESVPLGTGGAIRQALPYIQSQQFLALNGDSYCPLALEQLLHCHQSKKAEATLQLAMVEDCSRYGTVVLGAHDQINAFREKSLESAAGLINAGVYILEKRLFELLPPEQIISMEKEVFPSLVGRGLFGLVGHGTFIDIGTPESYRSVEMVLEKELAMLEKIQGEKAQQMQIERIRVHLVESAAVMEEVANTCLGSILVAANLLTESFRTGNKLLLCGNGGSAADCQHLAAEFVSRLTKEFVRPGLPAIALTTDSSFLTAYANDLDFEGIFMRQVETLGKPGDVLLGISTSGNSANVLAAIHAAQKMGIKTIGLTGIGGKIANSVDCAIVIPSANTQYVQESSLAVEHMLCDITERALFSTQTEA